MKKEEYHTEKSVKQYRWTILCLVFFATTINYLDRQVISLLKDDYLEPLFGWNESDYANIVIAFQITYALGMLGSGFIIDKIGTKRGYALALFIWSIASIAHAFVKSTFGFLITRSALGFSEAGNFPAAIKTVAEWFPKKERALATGIFNSGTNVGAIFAPLCVPFIAIKFGWEWTFILTGAIGIIWLIFWFVFYQTPQQHKKISKDEFQYITNDENINIAETQKTKWISLLFYKQTWAFAALKFFTDPVWWFILFWLPSFLNRQYGMTKLNLALPIAVVYTMAMFGSIIGGWLSGHLIKLGWPVYKARRLALLIFALCALPMLAAQWLGTFNYWNAVAIIGLTASAHQAWSANIFTTVSDMFPKKAIASVVGIGGTVGAVGGVLISKLAGFLLTYYSNLGKIEVGYYIMFIICSMAYIIAWIIFSLLAPKMPKAEI
ncbi:MFS transporter [Mucilaginibacter sp. P25]|uniref:MFS transporter, ACS family, hexuronate transporter n=1 Tax=Mucilaginibacter gossypii TaxID=551996 RepID=A0A1G7YQ93_9SPHI|nr:MFS transporter [Mucilaginibacter gossypii]SDG98475.1 MFS transporter, ACS family, hexuronate transporter [Mucilaginibacter gossypii]